ncbi:MAG: ISL3 family transposase [Steroidobacteraceae bacterium]
MVPQRFQYLSPAGLLIHTIEIGPERIVIAACCRAVAAPCPECGRPSGRVHSHYERRRLDLPSPGRTVQLRIAVRRFRCATHACRRHIFAQRLDSRVADRSARCTSRLEAIVYHLGIAMGGRPAATLAQRLMLPVSKDTLLRVVRRPAARDSSPLCIIGVDDWAWKKGQRYGSIVCDLERRCVVDLLPDREAGAVMAWLSRHPEIRLIARDRGGGYAQAAAGGASQAVQVADRWHLMENASAAFLEAVHRSMRAIRKLLGSTVIDLVLLTHAERLQHEGYLRRGEVSGLIRALTRAATPIKEIVRRAGRSRKLVREIVRGGGGDLFRGRSSTLEPYLAWLDAEWSAGCRNGAELWRRLWATGFTGCLRVVTEWAARRRRAERTERETLRKVPPAHVLSRLMLNQREPLSREDAIPVASIETGVPVLAAARDLVERFHRMVRQNDREALLGWIVEAAGSMLSSFAKGLAADHAAVAAALTEPWSNGQTEGQITRLKLIRRQMYGRGKLDLLRARLGSIKIRGVPAAEQGDRLAG